MNDIIIEGLSTVISLAVGGLIGYAVAYVTGLRAIRKGMQLILRASLNDMYHRFKQIAPTAEEKQVFEEMYSVYEKLAENGVTTTFRSTGRTFWIDHHSTSKERRALQHGKKNTLLPFVFRQLSS